jgi:hypothetical protein
MINSKPKSGRPLTPPKGQGIPVSAVIINGRLVDVNYIPEDLLSLIKKQRRAK